MIIERNTINSTYTKIYDYQKEEIAIPIFQRFYDWKTPQIVQLKNDLLEAVADKTKQLYFLDFIFYKEDNIIKLADGQQRLITINNFIKAIKDVAKDKNLNIKPIELFNISYDISANDKKYQTHFFNYPTAPFKSIYLDIKDFIESNISKIDDFIDIIKNNIFVFMKECENADDAFEIFQQINTGGKPLTKDEVIKTAIDQYSNSYGIKFDTSIIKNVRQSIVSFYKLKTNDLDKNFDNMAIITFLKDYITKDKSSFQDFVDTVTLLNSQNDNPIKHVITDINRTTLLDVLNILAMKKIDTKVNKQYMTKLMMPLCMMSISLTLNGGSPTTFRYLLNDIIEKIKKDEKVTDIQKYLIDCANDDSSTWKISLSDFTAKIGDINTSRGIKKALLLLDVIDKNTSGTINVESINLEHVYPQRPDIEWAAKGWPSHVLDQKEIIDNIGNYMLLCESVNKKIKNKYITQKVPQYNAIIAKDKILQTPINTIDFSAFENNGKSYIKQRQQDIAKKIQAELPMGKVLIT